MNCPKCNVEVGKLKKNQYINCKCGAKLMCIELSKKLVLVNLEENEGEK